MNLLWRMCSLAPQGRNYKKIPFFEEVEWNQNAARHKILEAESSKIDNN